MRSLIAICLALVVLMGLLSVSHALTDGDVQGLNELRRHFAYFNAPLGAALFNLDASGTAGDGGSWPAAFDSTSTLYFGCVYYGLCSSDGVVMDQIYVDLLWARATGSISQSDWNTTALAQLTGVTTISYVIPSDAADEAALVPFISALISALPASQVTKFTVIGTPTITMVGSTYFYEPVWTWTALTDLELLLTPASAVAATSLQVLKVAAADTYVVPSSSYGTLTTLALVHPSSGTTSTTGLSGLTVLSDLTLNLPPTITTWTLNIPSTVTKLTVIGLASTSYNGGAIQLLTPTNVESLALENLAGDSLSSISFSTTYNAFRSVALRNVSAHTARLLFCSNTLAPSSLLSISISTWNLQSVDLTTDVCLLRNTYTALTSLIAPFSWQPFTTEAAYYENVFPSNLAYLEVSETSNTSNIDFTGFADQSIHLTTLILYGSSISGNPNVDDLQNALTSSWLSMTTLTVYGSSYGRFTGELASGFLSSFTSTPVSLTLTGHSLTGTIPSTNFKSVAYLDLSHNQFSAMEALQASEVAGGAKTFSLSYLDVSNNALTSMLTDANLQCFAGLSKLWIYNNPSLSMALPTTLGIAATELSFLASNTSLSGSFSVALSTKVRVLDVSNTLVEGSLVEFSGDTGAAVFAYNYSFSGNTAMTGSIPASWSTSPFAKFDISNSGLTNDAQTTLPFAATPLVKSYIDISGTSISGDIWAFTNLRGGVLLADNLPNVNFCPTNTSLLPQYSLKPTRCSIDQSSLCSHGTTNACIQTWYDLGCISSLTPCTPVAPPTIPVAPPTKAPVAAPIVQCPLPAPSSSFSCVNGKWVSNSSITTSQLSLPASAGSIVVAGNLTVGSVTFTGLGSSLVIEGCVKYLPVVYVSLDDDDIEEIRKSGNKKSVTLASIASNSSCANSTILSSTVIVLNTNKTTKACRSVTANKAVGGNSLSATFTIDSSKCNRWWVILVSVICSVFIVVVVIIVVVKFVPACQVIIRPFKGTNAGI